MINFPVDFFDDESREGYFVPSIMKRCWAGQMECLVLIDEICKKHNIHYFAMSGTLIGTIRHGGFIPWDDDMDIGMLRADYEKFLKVIQNELPKEYYVFNIYQDETCRQCFSRIINDSEISNSEEYLLKNHGFLFPSGMDIFPFDYFYEDEDKRKELFDKISYLNSTMNLVDCNGYNREVRERIEYIRKEYGLKVNLAGNIGQNIHILMDEIFAKMSQEKSSLIQIPFDWFKSPSRLFDYEDFEKFIYMDFECIKIPVPYHYNSFLKKQMGEYMRCIRSGSTHDYPWYTEKIEELHGVFGIKDYTFDISNLPIKNRRKLWRSNLENTLNQIIEVFNNASAIAQRELSEGDNDKGMELLKQCQELANKAEEIDAMLLPKEEKRVVFLVWKPSYWNVFSELYKKEISNDCNRVEVVAVPYFRKNHMGKTGEAFLELDGYPDEINVLPFDKVDFKSYRIDRIYFQNPFDEWSEGTEVYNEFFTSNLSDMCDELIYVPFFTMDQFGSNDRAVSMMKHYLYTPGVVKADKIVLQGRWLKNLYIDELLKWAGNGTKNIWEEKIEATDILKKEEKSDDKKKLLYYIGCAQVLEGADRFINKLENNYHILDSFDGKIFVYLCIEKETLEIIRNEIPEIYENFNVVINMYDRAAWCEIIHDYKMVEDKLDAFYGDGSVAMHRCAIKKIPVMMQSIEV